MAGVEHGVDLGGGRSSGELGVGVREHGRRSWGVLRTPEITVSTSVGSDTSWGGCGHGHAMAGGEEQSAPVKRRLGYGNEREEEGEWKSSSQGLRRWPRGARGGTGADEFDEDGRRSRG